MSTHGKQRGEEGATNWVRMQKLNWMSSYSYGSRPTDRHNRPIRFLRPGWEIISPGAKNRPFDTYWNLFICQYFHPTFANNSTCNWLTVHWGVPRLPLCSVACIATAHYTRNFCLALPWGVSELPTAHSNRCITSWETKTTSGDPFL